LGIRIGSVRLGVGVATSLYARCAIGALRIHYRTPDRLAHDGFMVLGLVCPVTNGAEHRRL